MFYCDICGHLAITPDGDSVGGLVVGMAYGPTYDPANAAASDTKYAHFQCIVRFNEEFSRKATMN